MIAKLSLLPLLLLPSLLPAQDADPLGMRDGNRGVLIGVSGFTGGDWQPSGIDLGLIRGLGRGQGQSVSLAVRLGSFVQDDAVLYGRTTGFFLGAILGLRAPIATIADVGTGPNPSAIRFVGVLEAGGWKNFNSPLPQGGVMGSVAPLVGISFSSGAGRIDRGFAILVGPAWFIGKVNSGHVQLSLRYQS
jgi:hypothetical protein